MSVIIKNVQAYSIASKKNINKNDKLVSINSHNILDILDYDFYLSETKLKIVTQDERNTYHIHTITKDEYEDIGLEFDDYLMDKQQHCKNKCIFCFIDQLPKGMRESLYFKDDDSRLSFLFGNYITLTNLTHRDVERIIEMHISPINISVHTTNPDLRVKMMKNPKAGESLNIIKKLADSGITVNTQLVLCSGINDGDELKRTLTDLSKLYPQVQMVAAVPLGVTKYRDNLEQLELYNKKTSGNTIDIIEEFANEFYKKHKTRFAFAADEFYINAQREIPNADFYEDFSQLENGVGMCALIKDEFFKALDDIEVTNLKRTVTISTGVASYDLICELAKAIEIKITGLKVNVVKIINDFFGETITVSGLITGKDLINQLNNIGLGDALIFTSCMLRSEGDIFLDDVSVQDVEKALNVKVIPTDNDGYMLVDSILGI